MGPTQTQSYIHSTVPLILIRHLNKTPNNCGSNFLPAHHSCTSLLHLNLNFKPNDHLPQMEISTQPSLNNAFLALTDPALMPSPISFDFDALRIQRAQLDLLLPDSPSDEFSRFVLKKPTLQGKLKCHFCKKLGHKIRTCRYKRRRDKIRQAINSLAEKPSVTNPTMTQVAEAPCCLVLSGANEETDLSAVTSSLEFSCIENIHHTDGLRTENTDLNLFFHKISL